MTRSDLIATITSRFANLIAKDAEIAVPVPPKYVQHFTLDRDLRARVEASAEHSPLKRAALDAAA